MYDLTSHVLVVDDMGTMRKIVSKSLKEIGFTTFTEAADGALAWQALTTAQTPVGLIVSDWNMPNCTGIEFLKRVRGDARFKNLPFFLLTAESEKGQIIEALTSGVSGYVIKPFTTETLRKQLEGAHKKSAGTAK